jgi:hypothetical protein
MGYAVLRAVLTRAMQRRLGIVADLIGAEWTQSEAGAYLHAVAASRGVQLDEYSELLIERPPMEIALRDRPLAAVAAVASLASSAAALGLASQPARGRPPRSCPATAAPWRRHRRAG